MSFKVITVGPIAKTDLTKRSVSLGLIVLFGLLTGCSSNGLLQSNRSVSTDSVDELTQGLDEDIAQYDKKIPAQLPSNVANALLPSMAASAIKTQQDKRFDIAVKGVDAKEFFRSLVKGTKYNVMVHPDVEGKISLELSNVTVPQVMTFTKELYGFDFQESGDFYRIMPGGLKTQVFQINYLNVKRMGGSETRVSSGSISEGSNNGDSSNGNSSASASTSSDKVIGTRISTTTESDFWAQLSDTLLLITGDGQGQRVVATPNAGVIVVRAMPEELKSVENYLRQTELIMQRQVVLEAKILEVELNEGYQQGIDWTAVETSGSVGADGLPKKLVGGNMISELISSEELGGVFTATLKVGDFSGFMQLLGTQGSVQVLSSPRISTVNNQKAVIKVGTDEFFVTDIDIDEDNGNSGSSSDSTSTDVTLTPFFSGIALDVTPQISEEGSIILHVHPTISEVKDQQKVVSLGDRDVVLPLALSTIRETDSVIKARNGQIVVIGGLIQNISRETNSSVPILGDIPLLGELFKQKRYQQKKSELVILLRPIISSDRVYEEQIRDSRKRFGEFRDILASPIPPSF
ncbi:pilus (MSHA type) biogenesis protein MshL [Alkalimarinus alittae]|uniref:Pilus (MSHA type) biogenesis protein MshL n=1 Tax=Alkalimarinus alittae TaxID=2961619 RepID=A0ABY6N0Z9_9ALTE|nr:pilus (MSHA type) biogenesis protein MshL [Alkalimarinus alittae]UZE95786.1 pilus (MSHA type) biogenesis protein MshL [Alkalimarinus alittae]